MEKQKVDTTLETKKPVLKSTAEEKGKEKLSKTEDKAMDELEKIREQEKAKLDALKEKEQEKTRIAIEKERARLEEELAKEIRELESQLSRAKNASQRVKVQIPASPAQPEVPTIIIDEAAKDEVVLSTDEKLNSSIEILDLPPLFKYALEQENILLVSDITSKNKAELLAVKGVGESRVKTLEAKLAEHGLAIQAGGAEVVETKAAPVKKAAPAKKAAAKKPVAKKAATKKPAAKKAAVKKVAKPTKAEEQAKARLAKEKADEKARIAKEKADEKARLAAAKKAEEQAKLVAEQEAKEKAKLAAEKEAKLAAEKEAEEKAKLAAAKEAEEKVKLAAAKEAEEQAKLAAEKEAEEKAKLVAAKEAEEKAKAVAVKEVEVEVEVPVSKPVRERPIKGIRIVKPVAQPEEESTIEDSETITSLQKLRDKISAQKQLERKLLEREALKVQEQEKQFQEKYEYLQKSIDEDEEVTQDYLDQEKQSVDSLRKDKRELESHLEVLQDIIDRIVALRIGGIKVIDEKNWGLTEEFQRLGLDSKMLNDTVKEIEKELDSLSASHEANIRKLIYAEEKYKQLERTHSQQEQLIRGLNLQVTSLKDQVAQERVINREYNIQIERLKDERMRFDRDRYPRPEYFEENPAAFNKVLRELDKLNDEVKKLIANEELKKVSKDLLQKDLEIQNLKQQMETMKLFNQKDPSSMNLPFFANPAQMFMPKAYPPMQYQQESQSDVYAKEVEKLRQEIQNLKGQKISEPQANPEVLREVYEAKYEAKLAEETKRLTEEAKKYEEEARKLEEEVKNKALEIDKTNLEKIKELEQQISEKEQTITELSQKKPELTEEDIFDPAFKQKIKVVREKQDEVHKRIKRDEALYLETLKDLNRQISLGKATVDQIKDKIFDLDMSYRQNRDKSGPVTRAYEQDKNKAMVELQLQEEKLNALYDDFEKNQRRLDRLGKTKDEEIERLKQEELSIIKQYLDSLIQEKTPPKVVEAPRRQPQENAESDSDKQEDSDIITEIDAYAGEEVKDNLLHRLQILEADVRDQEIQYNNLQDKITELKVEFEKRIDLQNNLKQNDDDVLAFTSTYTNYEECRIDYEQRLERIELLQLEIANTTNSEELSDKKAEINELVVIREDLKAKMEFYKTQLNEFESNENISMYKKLINQINQIKKITKDHYQLAETIKEDVASKTQEIEQLKEELKSL